METTFYVKTVALANVVSGFVRKISREEVYML